MYYLAFELSEKWEEGVGARESHTSRGQKGLTCGEKVLRPVLVVACWGRQKCIQKREETATVKHQGADSKNKKKNAQET